MCYTQYLKRRDGSYPITRGCIVTRTSLLCENRRPAVANWPVLACCKNQLCNEQLPAQFAGLVGNLTVTPPAPAASKLHYMILYHTAANLNTAEIPKSTAQLRRAFASTQHVDKQQGEPFAHNSVRSVHLCHCC